MKRSPLKRRKPLERKPFKRRPKRAQTIDKVAAARERAYKQGVVGMSCEAPGCDRPAEHAHHIIERQHLKRIGADLWDPRNRLAVCATCHANHHAASSRLPLPGRSHPVWQFAAELGLEWLLLRYYRWPQSRFSTPAASTD